MIGHNRTVKKLRVRKLHPKGGKKVKHADCALPHLVLGRLKPSAKKSNSPNETPKNAVVIDILVKL